MLAFLPQMERDVLEFHWALTPYQVRKLMMAYATRPAVPNPCFALQRMLAHKVAQYHGLQTATADYEPGGVGRVVAHRRGPVEVCLVRVRA